MSVLHGEDQKIARLKSVGLFAGADDTALRHLASVADEVHVAAGTVIISEGHHHSEGYIVAEGTASVLIDGAEVAEIGVNEVFGELGLFGGHPTASATVAAKTDVAAFVIPYNRFDQVLDENPQLLRAIVRQLAERLRATDVLYHDH